MVRHLNNYHSSNSGRGKDKHDIEGSASLKCIEDTDAHANFHPQLFPTRKPTSKQASKNQLEDCDGVIRVPSGSGYRMMKPFPWLLHEMLDDIEEKKLSWIVSWMPDGKAFQVHSAERFADTILPTYFRHKRYKSFQRQLYLYGFRSLQDNSIVKGKYFHPLFMREDRTLCTQIVRPKSVSTSSSRSKSRSPRTCKKVSRIDANTEDTVTNSSSTTTFRLEHGNAIGSSFESRQPCMLSGSFDPLPYTRSVTSLPEQSMGSKLNGFEECAPHTTQLASNALLKNMQLALLGIPLTSQNSLLEVRQGEVLPPPTLGDQDYIESYQYVPEGPIYSMSLGNSNLMNFKADSTYEAAGSLADPIASWNFGTASIQELEPYSDSIITLFGSSSEFLL